MIKAHNSYFQEQYNANLSIISIPYMSDASSKSGNEAEADERQKRKEKTKN